MMLSSEQAKNLSEVRQHTRETIRKACLAEQPVLVEAPPNSGKSTTAYSLAAFADKPVTYLAGRIALYDQAKEWCEENAGLSVETIPSPHRDCPTFRGDNHGDEDKVKRLYGKGPSGYDIHHLPAKVVRTPCMSGSVCPYIKKIHQIEQENTDLLIGHHTHGHTKRYIKDRIVIIDEFNADPFIDSFPDKSLDVPKRPGEIISHFIKVAGDHDDEFPAEVFNDVTDIIAKRDDIDKCTPALEWFQQNGATQSAAADFDFLDVTSYRYNSAHLLAPFLTLGLFCMEKVGPGIEIAPPIEGDRLHDIWKSTGLELNSKCLRHRNTGEMHVLRPPDLSPAAQVIGLDAIPTVDLWNILFAPETGFDHRQIIDREDFNTYLASALNMSIMQIGDGMHHYAGGQTSNRDKIRFASIKAREQEPFCLITSKKALENYTWNGLRTEYMKKESSPQRYGPDKSHWLARNYGDIRSSNFFEEEQLGAVFGTPFPGDDIIEQWAGFCGQSAISEGEGATKSFGEFGDRIYYHFTHHQVIQAILRFGRHESVWENGGATVYVSTQALPEWFEVNAQIDIRTNQKENGIIRGLINADRTEDSLPDHSVSSLEEDIDMDVDSTYIRDTLERLEHEGIVTVRNSAGRGGADLYRWDGDSRLQELSDGSHTLHGGNNQYVLDSL